MFFYGAGDEARLHFDFFEIKINIRLGLALAANSPPDCWILFFEPLSTQTKKEADANASASFLWSG